jgi:nicotinamide-nucleotide amidase
MAKAIGDRLGTGLLIKGNVEVMDLLSDFLVSQNMVMASAESCTGGLVGKLMTDRAGSSAWFWGAVVSYANRAKEQLLGVRAEVLSMYGAVSKETVLAMAEGLSGYTDVDLAISISGIAGPDGGTEEKPVGTVWFGFAGKDMAPTAVKLVFSSYGRSSVRRRAAIAAIMLGYFYLKGGDLLDIVGAWQYI